MIVIIDDLYYNVCVLVKIFFHYHHLQPVFGEIKLCVIFLPDTPCVREMSTRHAANALRTTPYFSDGVVGRFSLTIQFNNTVCPEKRDQNFFCNFFYKIRAILMKFGT